MGGCDCKDVGPGYSANSPLCQGAVSGYSTTQQYAKAYPGLRELEVLKDLGDNGISASICPKNFTGEPGANGYDYNAAADAIATRLVGVLQ